MKMDIVISDYIAQFTKFLSTETYKLIKITAKSKGGRDTLSRMVGSSIKYLIEAAVTDTLKDSLDPKLDKLGAYNMAVRNLTDFKQYIQIDVADGFTLAMTKFSKKNIEYYCLIKPIPEMPTKEFS